MSAGKKQLTCAICIEEIPIELDVQLDSCDHRYCKDCITKWLKDVTNKCPQCKEKVHRVITKDILGQDVIVKVKNKVQRHVEAIICERCHEGLQTNNNSEGLSVD